MSNPQRSLGLDSSALSPKEFDAYYPLIHSHSHQTTQSHQQGTTVADIWGWLKDNAIGDVNSSIENEILSFYRTTTASPTFLPPLNVLLALLRLYAHSTTSKHLTKDHLFIQTDPCTIKSNLTVQGGERAGESVAQSAVSFNPFRGSPLRPGPTSSGGGAFGVAGLASPSSTATTASSGTSGFPSSGISTATSSSSRAPAPLLPPPPTKRRPPSPSPKPTTATATVPAAPKPPSSNPFRPRTLSSSALDHPPIPKNIASPPLPPRPFVRPTSPPALPSRASSFSVIGSSSVPSTTAAVSNKGTASSAPGNGSGNGNGNPPFPVVGPKPKLMNKAMAPTTHIGVATRLMGISGASNVGEGAGLGLGVGLGTEETEKKTTRKSRSSSTSSSVLSNEATFGAGAGAGAGQQSKYSYNLTTSPKREPRVPGVAPSIPLGSSTPWSSATTGKSKEVSSSSSSSMSSSTASPRPARTPRNESSTRVSNWTEPLPSTSTFTGVGMSYSYSQESVDSSSALPPPPLLTRSKSLKQPSTTFSSSSSSTTATFPKMPPPPPKRRPSSLMLHHPHTVAQLQRPSKLGDPFADSSNPLALPPLPKSASRGNPPSSSATKSQHQRTPSLTYSSRSSPSTFGGVGNNNGERLPLTRELGALALLTQGSKKASEEFISKAKEVVGVAVAGVGAKSPGVERERERERERLVLDGTYARGTRGVVSGRRRRSEGSILAQDEDWDEGEEEEEEDVVLRREELRRRGNGEGREEEGWEQL